MEDLDYIHERMNEIIYAAFTRHRDTVSPEHAYERLWDFSCNLTEISGFKTLQVVSPYVFITGQILMELILNHFPEAE